jgi:hypothetical protein
VLTVRRFQALALTSLVVLLAAFSATTGLHTAGWVVGLLCGVIVNTVVPLGLARSGSHVPGPADLVTLTRAVITCVLAALTADALLHHVVTPWSSR